MGSPFAFVVTKGLEEWRDLGAVDVIAAALALGFEYVARGVCFRGGKGDGVFAGGGIVKGVEGCKSVADAGDLLGGSGGEEAR